MKKALFLVLAIVAICFLLGNADTINDFVSTVQTGATGPIILAIVFMLLRHLTQAYSYKTAFEAVDLRGRGIWEYIVLIFSLVFINTFCLFSGATGVAFIIDDAHRKGADLGKSTSGAILSQIGYFAAVLVISIIGFVTMIVSGSMNVLFVVGGLLLAGTLLVLSSLFVIGYYKPDWLYSLFAHIEKFARKVVALFKKVLAPAWGSAMADSFIKSARIMAHNPSGTAISVGWASLSAIINMVCLVAIGYAFGFENVAALIAAFALAAISVILSPTPQGVGVVEAAIAAVLTAAGCDLAAATAIALVYRGIMFWIPFCIGAVLLSQSGFFSNKKNPTQEQHDKDVGWISGTLVGLVGLVNFGITLIPWFFEPYQAITSWINFGDLFGGPTLVVAGIVLIVLAVGLILRYRTAWAATVTVLILVAGLEFMFYDTIKVAIPILILTIWLFWKRSAFDKPFGWLPGGRGLKRAAAADSSSVDGNPVSDADSSEADEGPAAAVSSDADDGESTGSKVADVQSKADRQESAKEPSALDGAARTPAEDKTD